MEKLQTITHPQFGQLSVIIIDGMEYFAANECAAMLGYSVPKDAISRHCKGALKRRLPTKGGNQEIKFIPESDVWRLIIRSKLPQAEAIERWIMDDVLPSIRKTGTYSVSKQPTQQKLYNYIDKTYKGKPVLTIRDVEHFTSLSKYRIQHFIQRADKGQDFIILTGNELAAFKYENSMLDSMANHLYLVTKSGFDKICAAYGLKPKMPELFTNVETPAPQLRLAHAPSESMRSLIGYIQRETDAIQAASKMLLTDDTKESLEVYRSALVRHIISLRGYCYDVKTIRI